METEGNIATKRRRVEVEDELAKDKVFSADEAALYDRQIRLWGVEAQKRLNNANILVIGMNGLGAEVCKNIILGGVKSVTMMDHHNVTPLEAACQFLIPRNSVVQNRAEASYYRAQQLNPMVSVKVCTSKPEDQKEEFYKDFTIICAIGCKKSQIVRLNKIARDHGIKFFAADVFGFTGYIFLDLGDEHNFTRENVISATKDKPEVTKISEGTSCYAPFQDLVDVNWNDILETQKKISACTHGTFILLEFLEKYGRPPQPSTRNEDFLKLKGLRDDYCTKHTLTVEEVNDELFSSVYGQLSPVCAINGGVLAQEIVKAISHRDEPIVNFFVYNPDLAVSTVESIYSKTVYAS